VDIAEGLQGGKYPITRISGRTIRARQKRKKPVAAALAETPLIGKKKGLENAGNENVQSKRKKKSKTKMSLENPQTRGWPVFKKEKKKIYPFSR